MEITYSGNLVVSVSSNCSANYIIITMAMILYTCGQCKHTKGIQLYRAGIGTPLYQCDLCGTYNKVNQFTEWELMGVFRKTKTIILYTYTAFFWAVAGPALLYFVDTTLAGNQISKMPDSSVGVLLLYTYLFSLAVMLCITGRRLFIDIKTSQSRMADPNYKELLISTGLLK